MRNADPQLLPRILGARKVFWRGALLGVACICFQVPHQASAQSLSSREYEIKAAYLYNFINFVEENNKVRFEINAEAARRTGLNISSELLKLARLVRS